MKTVTLDLLEADGAVTTEDDLLRGVLSAHQLYGDDFLYSAVSARFANRLASRGSQRKENHIKALTRQELVWKDDGSLGIDISTLLSDYRNPAIAVYRIAHLEPFKVAGGTLDHEYRFKEPNKRTEALEALVIVHNLR